MTPYHCIKLDIHLSNNAKYNRKKMSILLWFYIPQVPCAINIDTRELWRLWRSSYNRKKDYFWHYCSNIAQVYTRFKALDLFLKDFILSMVIIFPLLAQWATYPGCPTLFIIVANASIPMKTSTYNTTVPLKTYFTNYETRQI